MISSRERNKLSRIEIDEIFKHVSFNGLSVNITERLPKKHTIDRLLQAYYDNDHTRIHRLTTTIYCNTSPCSGSRASIDIRTSTPIISEITGIESKDTHIIKSTNPQECTETRLETKDGE